MIRLLPKIDILRRASVFNKKTRIYALNKLKEDASYLSECIKLDVTENVIFRNYQDYIVSVVLEQENLAKRFKPILTQKVYSSKEFLKLFVEDLNSIHEDFRIKKVAAFDTETTDLQGYIVSYAFVIQDMHNKEKKEIYELLNPEATISEEAFEVHKISAKDIKDKPTFKEKKDQILALFDQVDLIVGHNVLYDFAVLKRELERAKHSTNIIDVPIFDTMYYSNEIVVLDKKKMPRLEEAYRFFFRDISDISYHNALEDVKVTLKIFNKLIEDADKF